MPRQSAGILLYRRPALELEVLLVHPGGPFWARKDRGAWSIPKGEYETGEEPLVAALREFEEETGLRPVGAPVPLGEAKQPSRKIVVAFALEGDLDPCAIRSNLFDLEWPPRSGRIRAFPEIDRAGWFPVTTAREKILSGQAVFLDRLLALLGEDA